MKKKRSFKVKTNDTVKILRGKFKGQEGNVERINLRKRRIFIEGIQKAKADGTFAKIGVAPSNVIITKFDLKDKKRKTKLEGTKVKVKEKVKEKPKGETK